MAVLVDYQCRSCGSRAEHWTPSPPPPSVACGSCGAESRRLFAAVGLSGTRAPASSVPASAGSRGRGPTMCQQYPQIPGLCHMSESAARMWIAKATRNSGAVDREQERQEKAAAIKAPTMADAITHQHHEPAPASATSGVVA